MINVTINEVDPDVITETKEVIDVVSSYEVMSVTINQMNGVVIDKTVTASEIVNGYSLGFLPVNALIQQCQVEVIEPMDEDVKLTIGYDDMQGIISTVFDSELEIANTYSKQMNVRTDGEKNVKAYFPVGLPTIGKIRIIINYN